MGTLNVSNVQKYGEFVYVDGEYRLSGGFKATDAGLVTAVENGTVQKSNSYVGNFYVMQSGGAYSSNVNNVPLSDLAAVSLLVEECIAALNALDTHTNEETPNAENESE